MDDDSKQLTAPYGAFATFLNALLMLVQGVPHRIDRSAFPGQAWNATTRLLGAFRFLGLIDENGEPLPPLHKLAVHDEGTRKTELAAVLRTSYAAVFKLDVTRITPAHLAETIGEHYNATGDTRDKAVRFFLTAVNYVGIPVSQMLSRERGRKSPMMARVRRVKPSPRKPTPTPTPEIDEPAPTGTATRTVRLRSGGKLTFAAAVDFLSISTDDRNFVFEIIDKLSAYQQPDESEQPDEDEGE